jgi:Flp pilus assembly protein TadD
MNATDPVEEFKEGLKFLRNNYAKKAMVHFTQAAELDKTNPFYLSYVGLTLAAADRNWDGAEEICQRALKMRRTQAELYLNLAEVYRLAGRKDEAVETLILGRQMTRKDPRILAALHKYGIRRPPVLSFLDRQSFLNKKLGKARYRILKSMGKEL